MRPTAKNVAALALVALGGLAFSAAPASAALSFPFASEFAPSSGSFGFLEADSVAVDDKNGQTYVADSTTGLVTVFDPSHAQVGELNGSTTPAGSFGDGGGPLAVAANHSTGEVYVLDGDHNVVDVFNQTGGYLCQITGSATPSPSECNKPGGSATPSGGFSTPRGLAVNQSNGEVDVLDAEHGVIDRFTEAGAFASQVMFAAAPVELSGAYTRGLAVNSSSGDIYTSEELTGEIAIFDGGGGFSEVWTGGNTPAQSFSGELTVAVDDASGRVYVTDPGHEVTDVFESSGAYDTQFSHEYQGTEGTAVDQATGEVYVSNDRSLPAASVVDIFGPPATIPDVTTEAATGATAVSAALHGSVNPDSLQLTSCQFEYGTTTSYGSTVPCVPAAAGIPADGSPHAVEAEVAALNPGTTYHFRLKAGNANGGNAGSDATVLTLPRPVIDGATDAKLTRTSVDLDASVNPEGSATSYHFEYGPSTAYGASVPAGAEVAIPAGTSDVPVSVHIEELQANITYHWRVVATNANGTTEGSDHTFIYDASGGLPDDRAYEMVTPPQKNAALIGEGLFKVPPDVSNDGSRVIITSIQCFGGAQSCTASRQTEGEPYLFTRTGAGWVTTPLAPPAAKTNVNSSAFVNATTGDSLFSIPTGPSEEDDFYRRNGSGQFQDLGPVTAPAFGPLGTAYAGGASFVTPDMVHIVFELSGALKWPFDHSLEVSTYELSGVGNAAPVLVGVTGGPGSEELIGECGARLGERHALSEDGRVVYVGVLGHDRGTGHCPAETKAPPVSELYARIAGAETVLISGRSTAGCVSVSCSASPPGDARFEDASADGTKAFFADTQQLTDRATEDSNGNDSAELGGCSVTVSSGCNLYEYDFGLPAGHRLVAVSAGDVSGGGPRVQGVVAVSADGSHAFFVARGVLSRVANNQGAVARDGGENLYCYERDSQHPGGRLVFVATLTKGEQANEGKEFAPSVTPDGRYLVFTSHAALTRDDTSTTAAAQVYMYDAQGDALTRISVGQNGYNDGGNTFDREVCSSSCPLDASLAPEGDNRFRRDMTMSDDGEYIFFTSPVGLTPQALNEVQIGTHEVSAGVTAPFYAQNVYEWHAGRVSLISDGKDVSVVSANGISGVKLLGSDATGANVFFATADRLVSPDTDTQLDYYDARICEPENGNPCISESAPVLPPCLGEACHGTPAGTPLSPNVPSATFNGQGNITPVPVTKAKLKAKPAKCKKGLARNKRGRCVKTRAKKRRAKKSVHPKRSR